MAHASRLDNDNHALMTVELRVLIDLLSSNEHLAEICFTGARVRDQLEWLSSAIALGKLPLTKLLLADNGISVAQGVRLIEALRIGAPQLLVLDLSLNPICGVEEALDGGRNEFDTTCIEALRDYLLPGSGGGNGRVDGHEGGGRICSGCHASELHLVGIALCGSPCDGPLLQRVA